MTQSLPQHFWRTAFFFNFGTIMVMIFIISLRLSKICLEKLNHVEIKMCYAYGIDKINEVHPSTLGVLSEKKIMLKDASLSNIWNKRKSNRIWFTWWRTAESCDIQSWEKSKGYKYEESSITSQTCYTLKQVYLN